ncbi:Putative ABC-transporter type IV [Lachnospiraceae bacterium XBB1006]|nr:Putative ABC-transporter type IV [Lachnospiraceae bacterium XBB1006]
MWISRYVCLFIVYCCMGWIYETIYCTVKGGKWENRGFLYGPACPIYGVAVFIMDTTLTVTALLHFDRMVIRVEESFNKNMENIVDNAVQRTVSIKQDIQSKQAYMSERLESMGVYVNPAMRRVRILRYKDEARKFAGNHMLEIMKKRR